MKRAHLVVASLPLLFAAVGQARAGLIFYSDQSAFAAATTDTTTVGFEGIAPANGFTNYGPSGSLTLHGVTFSASNAYLSVVSGSYYQTVYGTAYNLGTGDFLLSGNGDPAGLHVATAGGFKDVAFDLGTFDQSNSQVTVHLSTGDVFTVSAPYPTSTFVGFTSTTPIDSLDLTITGGGRRDTLSLDNFTFGPVNNAPEPASLILFSLAALGFCGHAGLRRAGRG
jgi:hypothetical protein